MASPPLHQDLVDLLLKFNEHEVEYVAVGAFVVGVHSEPRTTKDLDLFIRSSIENAKTVYRALADFGAPLQDVTVADLSDGKTFLQLGVPPNRVDILQDVSGITFDEAWSTREFAVVEDKFKVPILSLEALLKAKTAAGRDQDLLDIKKLRKWNNLPDR